MTIASRRWWKGVSTDEGTADNFWTCKASRREHRILTAPVRDIADHEYKNPVHILCNSEDAKQLLAWATKFDPAAASQINIDEDPNNVD